MASISANIWRKQVRGALQMPFILWTIINLMLLLGTFAVIWLLGEKTTFMVTTAILLGQLALLLFVVNINMHFIFKVIKTTSRRSLKILLVKISRKMMKLHVKIALIGTAFVVIHAGIQLSQSAPYVGLAHPKLVTGYVGVALLALTLFGGYQRKLRASGFRRKFHLIMALLLGLALLLHIFYPTG
jgi:hypothetical protein